jgi:hypothetical protein
MTWTEWTSRVTFSNAQSRVLNLLYKVLWWHSGWWNEWVPLSPMEDKRPASLSLRKPLTSVLCLTQSTIQALCVCVCVCVLGFEFRTSG